MFLCTCVHACELSCSVMSNSLHLDGLQPARLLSPWRFSRQVYWSGLPCPPSGDLPNPGIESSSPTLQVDSLSSELSGKLFYMGTGHFGLRSIIMNPVELESSSINPIFVCMYHISGLSLSHTCIHTYVHSTKQMSDFRASPQMY